MKFLLDVCVSSHTLQAFLAAQGHDVLSAVAIDPKASDERLMAAGLEDERVLITEDKDFGELIFVRKLPHGPIVRLV
jgi:predicted nuclease of predicted toxin-antitoxin system